MQIDNSTGAPQQISTEQKLIARAKPDVADVPVPIGFDINESYSDAQRTPSVRYVSFTYSGRKGKDRVAAFYCEQMATNNKWRQDAVRKNRGVWRLHFGKGNERCDITVSENMWGTTHIYLEIYPIASGGS